MHFLHHNKKVEKYLLFLILIYPWLFHVFQGLYIPELGYWLVSFENFFDNPEISQTEDDKIQFALRELYYLEKDYYDKNKKYTDDLTELKIQNIGIKNFDFKIEYLKNYFEISVKNSDGKIITIRNDGKIWSE